MRPTSLSGDEPLLRVSSCARLEELLDRRNAQPECRKEIDGLISEEFEAVRAILVLDMAGFSFSVRRNGIIHHLSLIRRMHKIVNEVVSRVGGGIVKFEADNCFAIFTQPAVALQAAIEINRALADANADPSNEDAIESSIGIGYGEILLGCDDFFGDEVNLACKLGEDVADRNEVFLTEAAFAALSPVDQQFEHMHLTVSGLQLSAYKLVEPARRIDSSKRTQA